MSKQVVTASYTAYVEYMLEEYPPGPDAWIHPADYKTWAKWMATD